MKTNRKIGQRAAYEIADRFVCAHEFQTKINDLNTTMEECKHTLDEVVQEFANKSQAKQWYDTLGEDDKNWNMRYGDDVRFEVHVTCDDEEITTTLYTNLRNWWRLSSHHLRVLTICGVDTSRFDLRAELQDKMKDHPALVAYVRAKRAHHEYREVLWALGRRVERDIAGRKIKEVLEAWPELSDAIAAQYPEVVTEEVQPLQTPLADVIASIATPLITQE